jgi:hypothetical protein
MLAPVAVQVFSGAQLGGKQQLSEIARPVMPPLNKNNPNSIKIPRAISWLRIAKVKKLKYLKIVDLLFTMHDLFVNRASQSHK